MNPPGSRFYKVKRLRDRIVAVHSLEGKVALTQTYTFALTKINRRIEIHQAATFAASLA